MNEAISLDKVVRCQLGDTKEKMDLDKALYTDYDEIGDIRTYADFIDDKIITKTIQNPEPILVKNEQDRKRSDEMWNASPEWKFVARIPLAQWLAWEALGITQDDKALLKAIERQSELKTTNRRLA